MRERPNVCKYMDIALQHISDNMLEKMRRHVTKEDTYRLIEKFRKKFREFTCALRLWWGILEKRKLTLKS